MEYNQEPFLVEWNIVTVHTVSCTCCTASGQFSDGAGIRPIAGRRLFNGLDACSHYFTGRMPCSRVQGTVNSNGTVTEHQQRRENNLKNF